MKVLLLHYYSAISNPAYQQIATAMRSLGHEVVLGYRTKENTLELNDGANIRQVIEPPKKSAIPVLAALINKFHYLMFILAIRNFISEWQPDAVQLNRSNLYWHWVLPLLGTPKTAYIQDCRQVESPSFSINPFQAMKQFIRHASHVFLTKHVFTIATYLHPRGAAKELGQNWSKYAKVVPLGVDDSFLNIKPAPQASDDTFTFLYIGSITRYRKLDLLIEAAAALKQETEYPFKLVFAGPDNSQGYYQELALRLNATDVVSFLGPVPYQEIPKLIYRHKIALAYVPYEPNDWAYHPTLKILEYLALGAPVLATDVPPNQEIIATYNNGLSVANSIEGWKQGMLQFLQDQDFTQDCQTKALQNRQGTSWMEVAQKYIDVYISLGAHSE